jgi:zinc transport system permease protein
LTGLALGLVAGVGRPLWAMLAWAATQAVVVTWVQRRSRLAGDTVLGVCMALSVALGVLLLSRPQAGGMTRYVGYLTGDVLSVTPGQVAGLAVALGVTVLLAARGYNALALAGLHPSLAGSRGVNVAWVQTGFAVLVAVAVTLNIQWVGILLVNAFLILPAAAARLLARNQRQYLTWAVVLSLVASVGGLITSFYLPGAASGATIVLWAVGLFGLALAARPWLAGERVAAAR